MLHHASFGVSDIDKSATFYDAAFSALGYCRVWEDLEPGNSNQAIGYGPPGAGDKFAIKLRATGAAPGGAGHHLAFAAPSREAVEAFYLAAVGNGGLDNGKPGLRPHYGPHYFAAFVIDPEIISRPSANLLCDRQALLPTIIHVRKRCIYVSSRR